MAGLNPFLEVSSATLYFARKSVKRTFLLSPTPPQFPLPFVFCISFFGGIRGETEQGNVRHARPATLGGILNS